VPKSKSCNGKVHRRLAESTLQVPRLLRGDWPGAHSRPQPLMSRSNKIPGPRQGRSTLSSRLLARFSTVQCTSKSRRALTSQAVLKAPGPLRANPTPVQAPATELPLTPTNSAAHTKFSCVSAYHAPPVKASSTQSRADVHGAACPGWSESLCRPRGGLYSCPFPVPCILNADDARSSV
jgi:hypothetical protein